MALGNSSSGGGWKRDGKPIDIIFFQRKPFKKNDGTDSAPAYVAWIPTGNGRGIKVTLYPKSWNVKSGKHNGQSAYMGKACEYIKGAGGLK